LGQGKEVVEAIILTVEDAGERGTYENHVAVTAFLDTRAGANLSMVKEGDIAEVKCRMKSTPTQRDGNVRYFTNLVASDVHVMREGGATVAPRVDAAKTHQNGPQSTQDTWRVYGGGGNSAAPSRGGYSPF
jgi:hypothetical protein